VDEEIEADVAVEHVDHLVVGEEVRQRVHAHREVGHQVLESLVADELQEEQGEHSRDEDGQGGESDVEDESGVTLLQLVDVVGEHEASGVAEREHQDEEVAQLGDTQLLVEELRHQEDEESQHGDRRHVELEAVEEEEAARGEAEEHRNHR